MKLLSLATALACAALTSASIMETIFAPSCPPTLQATVPGYSDSTGPSTMAAVHQRLLACPDTKALDLRVALLGCSSWPDRWNLPFRLEGGDRYPALTSLKLEGYRFDERAWDEVAPPMPLAWWLPRYWDELGWWVSSGRAVRYWRAWWNVPVERRGLTNVELWVEAMDWSKLERLDLRSGVTAHVAGVVAPRLVGLRELTVERDWRGTVGDVVDFIAAVPAELESLAWRGAWEGDDGGLRRVLERHGGTLRSLDVHYGECSSAPPFLTGEQFRMVGEMAPGLRHVAINVDRNGTWPWETLESFAASLRGLRSADLWLELASDGQRGAPSNPWDYDRRGAGLRGSEYRAPLLNKTSASEVFEFLRAKSGGSGGLQKVTFYAGDFTRPWDGPIYEPRWLEGRRVKVVCSVEKQNDGSQEESRCVVEIDESGWHSAHVQLDLSDELRGEL